MTNDTTNTRMTEVGARRLADARLCVLRAPPESFTLERFHTCGTPLCVLGHYAAWSGEFKLGRFDSLRAKNNHTIGIASPCVHRHFEITKSESAHLFSQLGCDRAQTPQQAADYIAQFIRDRGFGYLIDGNDATLASMKDDTLLPTAYDVTREAVPA